MMEVSALHGNTGEVDDEGSVDAAYIALLVRSAQKQLSDAGIEHADHEALMLLAAAASVSLSDVRRWLALGVPEACDIDEVRARFADFCTRRASREPLQYIVGSVGFRFLELSVEPGVFIPRPETETVVQAGIDWLNAAGLKEPLVVDLCAGTGAVGLSVASEIRGAHVTSVEIDSQAFRWLTRNATSVKSQYPKMTFTPLLADATADETLQELNGRVDCIISNPPYVPESEPTTQPEVDRDPDRALYGGSADGMRIPELVIERAARLLRPGGYFVMEHDISQGAAVRASLVQEGFHAVETQPDLTGRPRFSVGTAGGAIMSGEQAEGRN